MKTAKPFGLGEPDPVGKMALFQPPDERDQAGWAVVPGSDPSTHIRRRVRTTIAFFNQALSIIQAVQNRHRLETGKVLPLWKLVSLAIEYYGEIQKTQTAHEGKKHPIFQEGPGNKPASRASLAQT